MGPVHAAGIKKRDNLTVTVPFKAPYSTLIEQLATFFYFWAVVPVGFDAKKPVGTGPFIYDSFTPGQRSVFRRNPNYWRSGLPHLDQVTITDFQEDSALVNALVSGQIDAAGFLQASDVAVIKASGKFTVLTSESGSMQPFTMRVDKPPFNDVRVRQAFRLLVDRPQMIEAGLGGSGHIGYDVFSPYDPDYDSSLVRTRDVAQAKSLLKAAGKENLTVELVTAPLSQGTVQMAQVFSRQAAEAGVNVKLKQVDTTTFYGPNFGNWTFAQDYWYYNPYLAQVAQSVLPTAAGQECHITNPHYLSLYAQANASLDASKRKELVHEMMKYDFEQGGYIIPAFTTINDAFSSKLVGLEPSKIGEALGNFLFEKVSLTA